MLKIFKQAPLFSGWLVFQVTWIVLQAIIGFIIGYSLPSVFPNHLPFIVRFLVTYTVLIIAGFLPFALSVERVVIPLSRSEQEPVRELVYGWIVPYFRRWVCFIALYLLLYALWVVVTLFHGLLPLSDKVINWVSYVITLVASYIAFRVIVQPVVLAERKRVHDLPSST
jgi:hypothetical protein